MQQPLPVADAPDRNRPIRIQPADAIFIYQTFYKPERKGIVDMRGIRNFTGNAKRIRCIYEVDLHLLPRKEVFHQAGKNLCIRDRLRVITKHF